MTLAIQSLSKPTDFVTLEPGIYPDVPSDIYHAADLCSYSRLKNFARSPAHCREALENPKQGDGMKVGEALHTIVLQPNLFEERFVAAEACSAILKTGKRKGEPCGKAGTFVSLDGCSYCGSHVADDELADVRTVLAPAEFESVIGMRDRLMVPPSPGQMGYARTLLTLPGECELSLVWIDEVTGVKCKARLDKWIPAAGTILDLKKTQDAKRFEYTMSAYGYDIQAPMYFSGARTLGLDVESFTFIPVEESRPHGVRVLETKERINTGEPLAYARRLMLGYSECVESGVWPDYPDEVEQLDLSPQGLRRMTERNDQ